jgi:hypothetical protein
MHLLPLKRIIYIACAVLVAYLVTWGWGRNQVLLPDVIRTRIHLGDSEASVRTSLSEFALPPTRETDQGDGFYLVIVDRGIGSLLTPQNGISLVFDSKRTVVAARATVLYRFDEAFFDLSLQR